MNKKLRKYHKDFEFVSGRTLNGLDYEFCFNNGSIYSNFYNILFCEGTSWGINYSDMNGLYDMFVPRMVAFDVDSVYSRSWHFNLTA